MINREYPEPFQSGFAEPVDGTPRQLEQKELDAVSGIFRVAIGKAMFDNAESLCPGSTRNSYALNLGVALENGKEWDAHAGMVRIGDDADETYRLTMSEVVELAAEPEQLSQVFIYTLSPQSPQVIRHDSMRQPLIGAGFAETLNARLRVSPQGVPRFDIASMAEVLRFRQLERAMGINDQPIRVGEAEHLAQVLARAEPRR